MSANDDLLAILKDAVGDAAVITSRRMFGGIGVYGDGFFFAILTGGAFYVRVSETTRPAFAAEGARPFTYQTKKGDTAIQSYWSLPERLLDEPDELRAWAQSSIAAARDVDKAKKSKSKPRHGRSRYPPIT